jgi:hypothetical protein
VDVRGGIQLKNGQKLIGLGLPSHPEHSARAG